MSLRAPNQVRRRRARGQSLVEGALMFPLLVLVTMGGISVDSYIQARAQLEQAVSRAALVAARDGFDPCLPSDTIGASPGSYPPKTVYSPSMQGFTSTIRVHGYQDVIDAFNQAITSPLYPRHDPQLGDAQLKPTITCVSQDGCAKTNNTSTTVANRAGVAAWWNAGCGGASLPIPVPANTCATLAAPQDNSCYAIWRGGLVTVSFTTTININWTPFYHKVTISASAGQTIEPFRSHTCPAGPANTTGELC